ncbi:Serine/threonine-protein kinase PknK [compost metagenome]
MNEQNRPKTAPAPMPASERRTPPRTAGGIVARDLHERLLKARRLRCIVLSGPAGCGKTTTLSAWRQQLLPLGYDFAWLTLSAEDNELLQFLEYLFAGLAGIDPAISRQAALLEGRDSEAVERSMVTLVRGIAAHPREVMLVLDDLHHLSDVGIHQALQWLIDYAPDNLHLVVASRGTPPLSLARLRSQGLALELGVLDLRFTPAESEQFLRNRLGEISAGDARRMHELTDGWAAGLQLLCVSHKKSRRGPGKPVQIRDVQAFTEFFEAEVLAQMSPTGLQLLLHMAVCNRFCASLCAALTGSSEALGDAMALLARMESDNLFLIPLEGSGPETWYRLHPLLRETLLKHFSRSSEEQQRAVHARAWAWFRDHDYLEDAVRHAVLGGAAAEAAALVESLADPLYATGDQRKLIRLVRQLPAEEVDSRVTLGIVRARMQLFARDFGATTESLQRLQHSIPESDRPGRFRLAVQQAMLALQRDDSDAALAVLPMLLDPPANTDPVSRGSCSNILTWLYLHRCQYAQARRIQNERPAVLVDGKPLLGTASGILQGRCLAGLSLAMEGRMTQAERVYREVLHEAERCGKSGVDARCLASALLGEVLYEINEIDAAIQLLAGQVDLLERLSIPDSVLRVLVVLAGAQWLAGNQQEAFAYLDRLEEYAVKLNLDRLLTYSLVRRIDWNLQLGELNDAEIHLQRLDAIAARHRNVAHSALDEIRFLTAGARIRWRVALGDLEQAAKALEPMIAASEARERLLGATRLQMLAAVIDSHRGNHAAAREKVLTALRRGQQLGLMRTLLDIHPDALELIRQVAHGEKLDPLLAFYAERLLAQCTPTMTAPAETTGGSPVLPGMEFLSERELEILHLLAQALPNKKIARALGLSPETVKWHLSNIYGKLGVSSRDEAVERMRDLAAINA